MKVIFVKLPGFDPSTMKDAVDIIEKALDGYFGEKCQVIGMNDDITFLDKETLRTLLFCEEAKS